MSRGERYSLRSSGQHATRSTNCAANFHGLNVDGMNLVMFVNALVDGIAQPHTAAALSDRFALNQGGNHQSVVYGFAKTFLLDAPFVAFVSWKRGSNIANLVPETAEKA